MILRKNGWHPSEKIKVQEMAKNGLSASEIAMHFPGKSRNAVIGICHRSKFALKRLCTIKPRPLEEEDPYPIPAPKPLQRKILPPVVDYIEAPTTLCPMPLAEASINSCRFIEGDARGMIICGYPVVNGTSWCPIHMEKCFAKR